MIGEVLEDLVQKLGVKKRLQEYEALLRWEEVVGEQIARVATAVRITKGILVIKVRSSVWRNELNMRKGEIIQKLNDALGGSIVTDIRFH
jgi:predicted nucleic acid-binding Zn ribbon protein